MDYYNLKWLVYALLDRNNFPKSKQYIAQELGIDLETPPLQDTGHGKLISAIDELLQEKKILTAFYPGDPPDSDNLVGEGTFGYYPSCRDEEYIEKGVVSEVKFNPVDGVKGLLDFFGLDEHEYRARPRKRRL